MSSFCLDTSAYSNFRRGNEEVAALLDRAELVGVSTIALGELRTGFLLGGRRQRNETELDAFLDNSVVEVLPVDAETTRHYAEIVAERRPFRMHRPGRLDCHRHLIASEVPDSSEVFDATDVTRERLGVGD